MNKISPVLGQRLTGGTWKNGDFVPFPITDLEDRLRCSMTGWFHHSLYENIVGRAVLGDVRWILKDKVFARTARKLAVINDEVARRV
jgi:hypothetical protein